MNYKKQNQKLNENEKFEKELIQSLRYYGYLFPESSADVERFEDLYGETEIDIPEHLDTIEKIKSNKNYKIDLDLSYNLAALSSKEQNDFELSDDIDLNSDEKEQDKTE